MLPVWLTDTITSDLHEATDYTLLWGLQGMVLRTVGDAPQYVPHVNEAQLRRHLKKHKLLLPAVEPGLLACRSDELALWKNQLATFNETVAFCKRVGVPRIVVSAFLDESTAKSEERLREALPQIASQAGKAGLQILVRNHVEHCHQTSSDLLRLARNVEHPALGLAWDIEEERKAGGDPEAYADLVPHLGLIYVGPMTDDEHLEWRAEQLEELSRNGYSGPACLAFDEGDGPTEGLRGSTRLLRMLRQIRKSGTAIQP